MRLTEIRNGKPVIPLRNAVYGTDMPYWAIELNGELEKFLSGDAVERLAAYEDTGLAPENVAALNGNLGALSDMYYAAERELSRYKQAERDGRLVVLPCIREFDNGEHGTAYEVLWWECRSGFMTKSFKTHAEAEAALQKGAEHERD